jgi:AcrR family transcriptional regulator
MARKKGDHHAKRVEIADAACEVILRVGLDRTSLNDIARQLGYTTGVLRHYFHDKEELLLFTKNMLFDKLFDQMRSAADAKEGVDRLTAMALMNVPTSEKAIKTWRVLAAFNGRAIGNSTFMRLQSSRYAKGWDLYIDELRALQDDGHIGPKIDPRVEGFGICSFVEGIAAQVMIAPRTWRKEELSYLVERYVKTVVAASR